jgi:hypothetical protein
MSAEATLRADLRALIGAERAGQKLTSALVETMVTYLVVHEMITDVSDVSVDDLSTVGLAAWPAVHEGADLPPIQKGKLQRWLSNLPVGATDLPGADARTESLTPSEDHSKLFGEAGPTTRDLRRLADDKTSQGLTGTRILRLSLALELGRVPSIGEVVGVLAYGSDPRISEPAKKQRKAGMDTLHSVLTSNESNLRFRINSFFTDLIREFAEHGAIEESSLITQMWGEAQALAHDDSMLKHYLLEFFKKYGGRGIPTPVDILITQRVSGTRSLGVDADVLKELKDQLKSFKSAADDMRRELASVKSELGRVKNSRRPGDGGGDKPGGRGDIKCHYCHEKGHIAPNCPVKKREESASAAAKAAADKDEDE